MRTSCGVYYYWDIRDTCMMYALRGRDCGTLSHRHEENPPASVEPAEMCVFSFSSSQSKSPPSVEQAREELLFLGSDPRSTSFWLPWRWGACEVCGQLSSALARACLAGLVICSVRVQSVV